MDTKFNIYFDFESNQEIIKYRKLYKEYILEVQEPEDLIEYGIDENKNPFHIVDVNSIKDETHAYEAVFTDCISDVNSYEIKVQPIGTYIIDFLNINLSTEKDLKSFAFKYGLDILYYLDESNYLSNCLIFTTIDFDRSFTKFFNSAKKNIAKIQEDFKESIKSCFDNSINNDFKNFNAKQRYFLSFHGCNNCIFYTKTPKLQKYSRAVSINYDSFFDTNINLNKYTTEELMKAVSSKSFSFAPSYYGCFKLESALFISFMNLLEIKDLYIKTCANCGKLFMPISKSNEIYCNNPLENDSSKTCRDVGADKKYKAKIKDDEIITLIRSTSSTLSMRVKRNGDIKEHKIKYDKWKKDYPIQMKKYQESKITKDELINWINEIRR